ncbi:MAG: hypothetical protein HUJ90_04205, partial [Bacteroidales bacterium]|nr:hypothetical protein [Bacteroidales bacterium]
SAIKSQFRLLNKYSVALSAEDAELLNGWRNKVYCGPDYKEGITSFLEKRKPQFVGKAQDVLISKE